MARTKVQPGNMKMIELRERIQNARNQLKKAFVGAQAHAAVDCMILALLTGENFVLAGEPGTAKSTLVRAVFAHVTEARKFSILMGSFTTEDKLFGPSDIKAFQEGEWRRVVKNRLADTELAFLDEVLKASDGTVNGMLSVLNERVYDDQPCPLWCAGAASNWPEIRGRTEKVEALWDRFLFRTPVDPLQTDDDRKAMLLASDRMSGYTPNSDAQFSVAELRANREEIQKIVLDDKARGSLVGIRNRLAEQKIVLTDRRLGKIQMVLRASAWLAGPRDVGTGVAVKVMLDDFDTLAFCGWNNDGLQIKKLETLLATCDAPALKKCQELINEAKQVSKNVGKTQAPGAFKQIADAIKNVRDVVNQQDLRTKNRDMMKQEIAALGKVVHELKDQMKDRGLSAP